MKRLHTSDGHVDRFGHRRIDAHAARRDENVLNGHAVEPRDLFAHICVAASAYASDRHISDAQRFRLAFFATRFNGAEGRFGFGRINFVE